MHDGTGKVTRQGVQDASEGAAGSRRGRHRQQAGITGRVLMRVSAAPRTGAIPY